MDESSVKYLWIHNEGGEFSLNGELVRILKTSTNVQDLKINFDSYGIRENNFFSNYILNWTNLFCCCCFLVVEI